MTAPDIDDGRIFRNVCGDCARESWICVAVGTELCEEAFVVDLGQWIIWEVPFVVVPCLKIIFYKILFFVMVEFLIVIISLLLFISRLRKAHNRFCRFPSSWT